MSRKVIAMARFKSGDTAFLVESNRVIREVTVVNCAGGMYLIKFQNGGGIRVKEHRLFDSEEEAKASIPVQKDVKRNNPWDFI